VLAQNVQLYRLARKKYVHIPINITRWIFECGSGGGWQIDTRMAVTEADTLRPSGARTFGTVLAKILHLLHLARINSTTLAQNPQ
jgi:hypothetical protein